MIRYRVNELRKQRGMTWDDLIRESGVSKTSLLYINNPNYEHYTSTYNLERIAKALGCKISELFDEEDMTDDK